MAGVVWLHAQAGTNGSSTGTANSQQDQDLNIPDAPSTVQPAKPPTPPATAEPPQGAPSGQAPAQQPSTQPTPDENAKPAPQTATPAKPPLNIRTVPEGQATSEQSGDQLPSYQLPPVQVNQVLVPVTVTDEDGRLVAGLTAKDFNVLENGQKQKLNFFTSDPFALSGSGCLLRQNPRGERQF